MHKWIALVDMNSFFASVEQLDFHELRGQPVIVTNGEKGSIAITASYEARSFGIKTGTAIAEAKQLCPHVLIRRARHQRYQEISTLIWDCIREYVCPDIEVSSIDEAYLDFSNCRYLYASPEEMAEAVHAIMQKHCPIPFSMGLSANKRMAKYAANFKKPNGITIIPEHHIAHWLDSAPIADICGIGSSMQRFFHSLGVTHCGQIKNIPLSVLAKKWGIRGKEIWFFVHGKAFESVKSIEPPPKSVSHSKVLPAILQSPEVILAVIQTLCERVAYRLRQHRLLTRKISLLLKTNEGIYQSQLSVPEHGNTGAFFLGWPRALMT